MGSASLLAQIGGAARAFLPFDQGIGNSFCLFGSLCGSTALRFCSEAYKIALQQPGPRFLQGIPPSHYSWHINRQRLEQIPAASDEERRLVGFLENRWLAKATGFFSSFIDWICPCFDVFVQVHPRTINCYARNPSEKQTHSYHRWIEEWKRRLPYSREYPLILTRPGNVGPYLPSCVAMEPHETIEEAAKKLAAKARTARTKIVFDATSAPPGALDGPFARACKEQGLDPAQIICIQRVQEKEVGGLRLLSGSPQDYQFLLEWIGCYGLTANRVELDRTPAPAATREPCWAVREPSKKEFLAYLDSYEKNGRPRHPQTALLLEATIKLFRGLLAETSEDAWNEIVRSKTKAAAAALSFSGTKELLNSLAQRQDDFFPAACLIEQVHSHLSALLEICRPFSEGDFPPIYQGLHPSVPPGLQPLASSALHASGMTSLAGILKAVEKTAGSPPCVLYGENTYFECVRAVKQLCRAKEADEASEKDWQDADLIVAQFNPALKRVDTLDIAYRVEKIGPMVRRALNARQGRPLTAALDCTFDVIDSPKVNAFLREFEPEIKAGALNVVCYRSGLKLDLLGMDNYCGAPLYMVHSRSPVWNHFDALTTDPALQTDRLSLNWFCLAYRHVPSHLESYQRQIFENTRALMNKVPARMLSGKNASYRVIPCEEEADLTFIDIRTSGPFHRLKAALLAGGSLALKCMEGGHPAFFRLSVGFFHPNFSMLFNQECSSIRLTVGLDPAQVDLLARCLQTLDSLNAN